LDFIVIGVCFAGGLGANDRRAGPNSRFIPVHRVSDSRAGHGDCQNQNKVSIILLLYYIMIVIILVNSRNKSSDIYVFIKILRETTPIIIAIHIYIYYDQTYLFSDRINIDVILYYKRQRRSGRSANGPQLNKAYFFLEKNISFNSIYSLQLQ